MTYIKPDPEMQEEQEDLIMSYLNADYLSTDNTSTPLSPPSSVTTSSASSSGGLSPEKHIVDDFMLDINSTDFLTSTDSWATSADNLFNPCFPQAQQQQTGTGGDLLGAFPFFLPTTVAAPPNFIQPFPTTMLSPPSQPTTNIVNSNNTSSSSSSTGSLSDSEQPKKKRGRKKREPVVYQNTSPVQPSLLAPKPLAPRPNSANDTIIKSEPVISLAPTANTTTNTSTSPQPTTTASAAAVMAGQTTTSTTSNVKSESSNTNESLEAQKQAQIQKRQERLIKNRAAALLSRKRKREHLTCLEEEKQLLVNENEKLNEKVVHLESHIQTLEKENLDLKQRLQLTSNPTSSSSSSVVHIGQNKRPLGSPKSTKATGVVFMIILFSFALFTLPSRTADRLTVGGGGSMIMENTRKQFPLIGSSSSSSAASAASAASSPNEYNSMDMLPTTDLVLINAAVRPRDLQTWINHKLDSTAATIHSDSSIPASSNINDLQTWSQGQQKQSSQPRHVYLYSKEFSQIAPMNPSQQFTTNSDLPILSLISPYNQTLADGQDEDGDQDMDNSGCQVKKYLQIDVQVLRSQVIRSQLMPLEQCETASSLLDGMKKNILSHSHHQFNNVTPTTIVKREKRAANKKLARVIV